MLGSAQQTRNYGFDLLDWLPFVPLVGCAYVDTTYLHLAIANGPSASTVWTARYDAAGNLVCRAVGSSTCGSGNEQLTYDPLGELIGWQNASGASEQDACDDTGAAAPPLGLGQGCGALLCRPASR